MDNQTSDDTAKSMCCSREQTFREVLSERIEMKEKELRDLKELSNALPLQLNHNADRALRHILRK